MCSKCVQKAIQEVAARARRKGFALPLLLYTRFIGHRRVIDVVLARDENFLGHRFAFEVFDERFYGTYGHFSRKLLWRIVEFLFEDCLFSCRRCIKSDDGNLIFAARFYNG